MTYGLKNAVAIVDGNEIPLGDIKLVIDVESYSINVCTKQEIELPTSLEGSE